LTHRRLQFLVTAAVSAFVATCHAANTDPFDFDYEVMAGLTERPALIFNDGTKTYIQPRAGQVITSVNGHAEGPYVVIEGTPANFTYQINGQTIEAKWDHANTFIGGAGPLGGIQGDQPADFDGFTHRLILIGGHGALDPVRALRATMPIAELVKALVPQGWSGSAEKDIDLTDQITFETHAGNNWVQAIDRLMAQTGLYANVDFDAHHIRLQSNAPKSAALNYAPGMREPLPASTVAPAAPAVSYLAKTFGALAIRDGDDTHIQIRFASKPSDSVTFKAVDGRALDTDWDPRANVMTIERANHFVVSDGVRSVRVTRTARTVYDFAADNSAHLQAVFDNGGYTYFKFAPSVVRISVTDAQNLGHGKQKGRYFRFNGMADRYFATADGKTVDVVRRNEVTFSDALTSDSQKAGGPNS